MSKLFALFTASLFVSVVVACSTLEDAPRAELPLRIPPTLAPTRSDSASDFYTVSQQRAAVRVLPYGGLTQIEGYQGAWPGPTIRTRRGRSVVVTQQNRLEHPVAVHNHGAKVAAIYDGHPVDLINPGQEKDYEYPNDVPAGTYWLHDHAMNATGPNVWGGLAMMYIVDDDVRDRLNLPSGEFDVPLVLQDRSFNSDNSLRYPGPPFNSGPTFGEVAVVNGVATPVMEVAARKYLFRILNGSDIRTYRLFLQVDNPELGLQAPFIPFTVVASDVGLLPRAAHREDLMAGPAERYEIVVDFSKFPIGTRIVLGNSADPPVRAFNLRKVMSFVVTRTAPDTSTVPEELAPIERLDPADAVVERNVVFGFANSEQVSSFGIWEMNGREYDPGRIDFRGKLNTVEKWTITNLTGFEHTLHIHLAPFQIISENGHGVLPEHRGLKDTVRVDPFQQVEFLTRWEGHTGIYVFHCHVLVHEDRGMMGQIEITP